MLPAEILKEIQKVVFSAIGYNGTAEELKGRNFVFTFTRQIAPPDGDITMVMMDGTIKNITVYQIVTKDGVMVENYLSLSFSTEDRNFRRKYYLIIKGNGKVYLVEKGDLNSYFEGEFELV